MTLLEKLRNREFTREALSIFALILSLFSLLALATYDAADLGLNAWPPRPIVENGAGMKARLTLEILDRYRFDETFELAGRGEELGLYFTNRWTRVPSFDD